MKKHRIIALASMPLLSCLCLPSALAQANDVDTLHFPPHGAATHPREIVKNTHTVYVGNSDKRPSNDSVESLIAQFYTEQYRQFNDPHAPYFMFLTRDANLAMGIGGKLQMHGWYDWKATENSVNFRPYNIPVPVLPEQRRGLGGSVDKSSLIFTVLGRQTAIGTYMVYVQLNMDNYNVVLDKAWMRLHNWSLGYASTTFQDPAAQTPTVDCAGPCGTVDKTNVLVRYFHTFKSGWSVAGGAEFPKSSQTQAVGTTAKCTDYIPDLVGLGQYSWDGGKSHVRASALMRVMAYRDLLTAKNKNVIGWGAHLSGRWQVARPFALYFSGVVGQGIGSYVRDLSQGNLDLVPSTAHAGKLIAPKEMGLQAGMEYKFSPRVTANVALSKCMNLQKDAVDVDDYRYGLYGAANVFYNITSRIQGGLEYVIGQRKDFDHHHGTMNRIDAVVSLSF